ncbi:hypothetical protein N2152v2_007760 [Parachlorella kessleri]
MEARGFPTSAQQNPSLLDGGTDSLPKHINQQAAEPHAHIFVAESRQGAVDALVCSQRHGDIVFLWGVRTREAARGKGLGTLLLRHVQQHARSELAVGWLLSTTIPSNKAMRRLFAQQGYFTLCNVDIWPSHEVESRAVELSYELRGQQQHNNCSHPELKVLDLPAEVQPPLLTSLPHNKAAALQSAAAASGLLSRWQVCTSLEQLVPIHELLRRPRAATALQALASPLPDQEQGHLHASMLPTPEDPANSGLLSWLPGEFVPLPFGQLGKAGEGTSVWLLPPPEDGQARGNDSNGNLAEVDAGILLLSCSEHHHLCYAGIVAGSEAALAAALVKALELQPRCVQFYIDRCERVAVPKYLLPGERGAGAGEAAQLSVVCLSPYIASSITNRSLQSCGGSRAVLPLVDPHEHGVPFAVGLELQQGPGELGSATAAVAAASSSDILELRYLLAGQGELVHRDGRKEPLGPGSSVLMSYGAAACLADPGASPLPPPVCEHPPCQASATAGLVGCLDLPLGHPWSLASLVIYLPRDLLEARHRQRSGAGQAQQAQQQHRALGVMQPEAALLTVLQTEWAGVEPAAVSQPWPACTAPVVGADVPGTAATAAEDGRTAVAVVAAAAAMAKVAAATANGWATTMSGCLDGTGLMQQSSQLGALRPPAPVGQQVLLPGLAAALTNLLASLGGLAAAVAAAAATLSVAVALRPQQQQQAQQQQRGWAGCPVLQKALRQLHVFQLPNQSNRLALAFDPVTTPQAPLVFGVEVFERGHRTQPHLHPLGFELFFIISGEGEAFTDTERMPVGPGDLVVFSPGVVHGIDVSPTSPPRPTAAGHTDDRSSSSGRMYCLELMLPNDQFAEVVRSGREVAGGLEEQDLLVMAPTGGA